MCLAIVVRGPGTRRGARRWLDQKCIIRTRCARIDSQTTCSVRFSVHCCGDNDAARAGAQISCIRRNRVGGKCFRTDFSDASARTIDTRRATHSRTAHGSRPFIAWRRSRVSLKSDRPTSAESSGRTQSMQSDDLVRDSIARMWRAHHGHLSPRSGRAWLAGQTRALFE
jgi:hypothetical protein